MARFISGGAQTGITAVDNSFILNYMPNAPENAVKAYLYALMASTRADAPDISDALGLSEEQLSDAFAYWQRMGLVRIADTDPLTVELLRVEPMSPAAHTRRYAALIESLSSAIPGRIFTGSELSAICDWVEVFGFSEETAALLVSDCARRRGNRVKMWQMNAEAKKWADAGVSSKESALEYIAKRDERISGAQKILSRWKLRRAATEDELELYIKWTETWGMSDEVISLALTELTSASQPSFKYLDSVLATFRTSGAITPEAITALKHERDADRELARAMLARAGINKSPTAAQQSDAETWRTRYCMAPELLLLCAESCRQSDKPWGAIKRTLTRWHEQGISDMESAKRDIEQHVAAASSSSRRGRALSHTSRTYSESDLTSMGVELLED